VLRPADYFECHRLLENAGFRPTLRPGFMTDKFC
jgi:hypothetical protein